MIISENMVIRHEAHRHGINAFAPYWGIDNFFLRQFFKVFSRIRFLNKIFFNRAITRCKDSEIIIFDSEISNKFLRWIVEIFPDKKLIFWYWNPIRTTISLDLIPKEFTVWTYSQKEADENKIIFHEQFFIGDVVENIEDEGYVFFVGKNKGRYENLKQYENALRGAGIQTKFVIVSDARKLIKKDKALLNKPLKYKDVQELTSRCHVVFDYCLNPADGLSLRPLEAVKYNKLLITNNKNILNASFYDSNKILLFDEKNVNDMISFCKKQVAVYYENKESYSFIRWYSDLCSRSV